MEILLWIGLIFIFLLVATDKPNGYEFPVVTFALAIFLSALVYLSIT